ncbi:MAG: VanZ family protein [Thermodesulfobacteriota bacterium]
MGLIFYLSSNPYPEYIPEVWNLDKLIHIGEYGILAILWFRALGISKTSCRGKMPLILAIIFTVLFGITDEVHQHFVPGRYASIYDIIADGSGAWLGLWLYRRFI